jgi:phosphoribosylformylglycinamidine synthase
MAMDFVTNKGIATAIGHAPGVALINPAAGSRQAIAESLLNIVWAPLTHGLKGVSLSANWMWPAKNEGENARLYQAVEAVSEFAIELGINIPTGKDSLSMTQKYPNGEVVYSPGTVIISAVAEVENVNKIVSPALQPVQGSQLLYIDFSRDEVKLGGSSFAQVVNLLGTEAPTIQDVHYFAKAFSVVQELIQQELILAGHDVSAGGLITTLLEMCFPTPTVGLSIDISFLGNDVVKNLLSENAGIVIQVEKGSVVTEILSKNQIGYQVLGEVTQQRIIQIHQVGNFAVDELRDTWYKTSYLLDSKQRPAAHARARYENYKSQPLQYTFPSNFNGQFSSLGIQPHRTNQTGLKAAVIREKGVNSEREMAYALYLAGFDVKDIHMTDLISGREDLTDVNLIVYVGGFSNSDVLGSAKGWAGAFLYNPKAKQALDNFYSRNDTLSLGVCNGCQLMMELGLLYPEWKDHPKMQHNGSHKYESAFVNVTIPKNNSVMLKTFEGTRLGVWVAHGEGKFQLPADQALYSIAATYSYQQYPGNPNDSDFSVAALCSKDGRHLAIMPHIERSLFPWNWGYYPAGRKNDQISPWIEAFINARKWFRK